ncbi:putative cucumisin [Helianthus anomalus]
MTVNAAGNDGPLLSSIKNYAPWILTVAASDTDRRIVDKLVLGNYKEHVGNAINPFFSSVKPVPLVYGKELQVLALKLKKR